MRARIGPSILAAACLAACGGGPPSPPALAYRVPREPQASYGVYDTVTISLSMLGQSLQLDAKSAATYGLAFADTGDGVTVTLSVDDLAATLSMPLMAPVSVDESAVEGDLVFSLDRRGNASVVSAPEMNETVGQLVSPVQVATSFFPALPGIAVRPGDTWVDTISYDDGADAGAGSQRSVFTYTVVGDTVVGGTTLLAVDFDGTSEAEQTLSLQGTELRQSTTLSIEGFFLWDLQAGTMIERHTTSIGEGTVSVAMVPTPLPTRIEAVSRARLERE